MRIVMIFRRSGWQERPLFTKIQNSLQKVQFVKSYGGCFHKFKEI